MTDLVPRQVASVIPPRLSGREGPDIAAMAAWLTSGEGQQEQCVREWIGFLAVHYAAFRAIRASFPRKNPGRDGKKDGNCFATSPEEMLAISNQLFILKSHDVRGDVLECGCFKGFSSSCLSLACRRLGYAFVIADSFAGLPADSDGVGPGRHFQAGDFAGSRSEVEQNIRAYGDTTGVEFVQGWFSDTLRGWDRPLALLWMDVDLASSTRDVLGPCLPHLDPRGALFSHEFSVKFIENTRIVHSAGVAGALARIVEEDDADYRAEYLWGSLAIVGRRTSVGFRSYKLLAELIPWLSRIGMPPAPVPGPASF